MTNRSYQKNCSPQCCERMRHKNTNKIRDFERTMKKQVPKTCKECGKQFFIKNNTREKYCSIYCRNKANGKTYNRKHPGRNLLAIKKSTVRRRRKIIQHFGGKCNQCGETDWRVLQVNHINGGGRKDLLSKGGSAKVYKEILSGKREGEFNLLCANCNTRYEYETGRRYDPYRVLIPDISSNNFDRYRFTVGI